MKLTKYEQEMIEKIERQQSVSWKILSSRYTEVDFLLGLVRRLQNLPVAPVLAEHATASEIARGTTAGGEARESTKKHAPVKIPASVPASEVAALCRPEIGGNSRGNGQNSLADWLDNHEHTRI